MPAAPPSAAPFGRTALAADDRADRRPGSGADTDFPGILALRRVGLPHDWIGAQRQPLPIAPQAREPERHARTALHPAGPLAVNHLAREFGAHGEHVLPVHGHTAAQRHPAVGAQLCQKRTGSHNGAREPVRWVSWAPWWSC